MPATVSCSEFSVLKKCDRAFYGKQPNIEKMESPTSCSGRVWSALNASISAGDILLSPFTNTIKAIVNLFKSLGFALAGIKNKKHLDTARIAIYKALNEMAAIFIMPFHRAVMTIKFLAGVAHPGIIFRAANQGERTVLEQYKDYRNTVYQLTKESFQFLKNQDRQKDIRDQLSDLELRNKQMKEAYKGLLIYPVLM